MQIVRSHCNRNDSKLQSPPRRTSVGLFVCYLITCTNWNIEMWMMAEGTTGTANRVKKGEGRQNCVVLLHWPPGGVVFTDGTFLLSRDSGCDDFCVARCARLPLSFQAGGYEVDRWRTRGRPQSPTNLG